MSKYTKLEDAKAAFRKKYDMFHHRYEIDGVLNSLPTIEVGEGEWIAKTESNHSHWICNKCGKEALLEHSGQMCLSRYCPDCGVKMKGEQK